MKVGEKLKNIFLEAAMNYNKMSNSEKAKANNIIRENVKEIMKPRSKTEREKELDRLAKEEKEEYERNKNAFYADPIDRKSTRLNSSHPTTSRMPSSA